MARRSTVKGVTKTRRLLQNMAKIDGLVVDPVLDALKDSADELEFTLVRSLSDDRDLAASVAKVRRSSGFSWAVGFLKSQKRKWRLAGWRAHFREFGTQPRGGHPGTPERKDVSRTARRILPGVITRVDRAVGNALKRFKR